MGESTNCWSGGRESRLIVEWRTGESTNCWSGGRESLLIVGVVEGRVY